MHFQAQLIDLAFTNSHYTYKYMLKLFGGIIFVCCFPSKQDPPVAWTSLMIKESGEKWGEKTQNKLLIMQ